MPTLPAADPTHPIVRHPGYRIGLSSCAAVPLLLCCVFACHRQSGDSPQGDSVDSDSGETPADCVDLPAGSFVMGSPIDELGRQDDEVQHEVTLTRAFRLGRTEVTQAEFEQMMGYNPATSGTCPKCPVESVTWDEAASYANARSRLDGVSECYACVGELPDAKCTAPVDPYACDGWRLPTEAEWEYAARSAGTVTDSFPNGGNLLGIDFYPCGKQIVLDNRGSLRDQAWYCSNSHHVTHPVGTLDPNPAGLSDMAGNVWEWTGDAYGPYPDVAIDPVGVGEDRVKRGGSWVTPPKRVRVAYREGFNPASRLDSMGFRIARTR